jgi:hypothetical protein
VQKIFRSGEEEKMCSDLWAEQPKPGQAAVGYIRLGVGSDEWLDWWEKASGSAIM